VSPPYRAARRGRVPGTGRGGSVYDASS
jgi:hypothetical protein